MKTNSPYKLHLLTRARRVRGYTYDQVGEKINMCGRTVRRVEDGETEKPDTVRRIASALGVDLEELVR